MKILITSNYAVPHGGVAETVYNLAKYLSLNKHEVTVVSFEKGFESLEKAIEFKGIKFLNDFLFWPWEIIQLINIVRQQDVIFIQTPYFVISNVAALLGRIFHKKVICLCHGVINIQWRNSVHLPLINCFINKWLFLNKENIKFVKKYVNQIKPYEIVKNGIELSKYVGATRESPFKNTNYLSRAQHVAPLQMINKFIFVGRLEKEKGMEETIELVKSFPEYDFGFIGDGPYKEELMRHKNVQLFGYLNTDEKIKIMRKYSCLLLPSHSEAFGLVILEAIAIGLPVITTDTNSNIQALVNGNGIVTKVSDISELRKAVREISKKQIIIDNDYLKEYDWQNLIKDYIAFLEI